MISSRNHRLNSSSLGTYLWCLFILYSPIVLTAQSEDNNFQKVIIEIEGEEVFDVFTLVQDHQGYIWMWTNLGLIRYDGIKGIKYDIKESDSAPVTYDHEYTLYVDYLGDIWIGAISILSKYNPDCDCLHHYPSEIDDINLTHPRAITEDHNNNLWIGTKNGSLLRYERESDRFIKIPQNTSDFIAFSFGGIYHLLGDQNNNLWIGTDSGLARYDISEGNIEQFIHDPSDPNSLLDNRIGSLYEDQQGQILIGTYQSGLHIYDPKSEVLKRLSFDSNNTGEIHAPYSEENVFGDDPYVNLIHQNQNGDYWIGTTGQGINHFNTKTKFFNYYHFDLVNPQVLWTLYEDRQGILWAGGGMGSGLFKLDLFERKYNLNTDYTNVELTYESTLNPGILWVTSQESGLIRMDLKSDEIKRYLHDENNINSLGHSWVRAIYQENMKLIWLGLGYGDAYGKQAGNGGIDRMDLEKETFTHYKLIRGDDDLNDFSYTPYNICEDNEGHLWLSTGPGGIFRSDKDKNEFRPIKILKNDPLHNDVFLNIVRIDSNGDIWASDFGGEGTLYLYDQKEEEFNPYLRGFKMYNLLIDEKGWLLISTWEKGLVHLNPVDRTFIQYTKTEGLPSNDAVDIIEDGENSYWIGTRMGPAKFNNETGKISSFGIPTIRYNRGIFKASDNQLYLGSSNGLVSFYPDQVQGNPHPPQISISDILIFKTEYSAINSYSDELTFPHDQNDISFKYVGLHFSDPEKITYKFRLDPIYMDGWLNVGSEKMARYFNLAPGSYRFDVQAANSDGVWSEQPVSVQFTITPPWWTTWWAYALYIGIFGFLAYRIYNFQLSRRLAASESKRLKELNQFKNTLFTNITHEFRTPLTVIKGMTDSIKSNLKNNQLEEIENSLEMIDRNSDGLLHLVNEMLDLAKLESRNMELNLIQADVIPFLKYLCESFHSLAEENQINLMVYSEVDELMMDFDTKKLTSIISNLLSNAIKFTDENGKIIVHINQLNQNEKPFLFIKVKDNGIGIEKEELQNIFNRFYQSDASSVRENEGTGIGLALTKEFVDLMKGTIEAKSTLNKGSEFSVMIPVTRKAILSTPAQKFTPPTTSRSTSPSTGIAHSRNIGSDLPLLLIIEDNYDVTHYLKTCLSDKYETIHAVNGKGGIEMAIDRIPDIIISDVMMPEKDGFEVCETLKSDERTDHIPIIILTAKATFEDKLKGLTHGADAYLAKPFVKEELYVRLDQLISTRKKLINKIQKEGYHTLLNKRTKNPKLQFLQKASKLIHEDIGDSNFGSKELAKNLSVSESQVYRKIKAITGKSTAVYIRSIRLQYAREILKNSDKTVSEVAYEVGFNDPSWFSRAFKEEFGLSPSEVSL